MQIFKRIQAFKKYFKTNFFKLQNSKKFEKVIRNSLTGMKFRRALLTGPWLQRSQIFENS